MSSAIVAGAAKSTVDLTLLGKRADVRGRLFQATLLLTLLLALGILLVLLWTTWTSAQPVFADRGLEFVRADVSSLASRAGVWQGIIGSMILIGFVAVVALPVGIAAAIYLQEYAKDTKVSRLVIANIRNLAGVPSVVYGILGLVVLARALRGITGPDVAGLSYISGGLTLAVLVMPIVILVTMEALRAVPGSIREAAYGVGATRWEVVRSHVLPYAAPGLFTGGILSLARAFGETAPLLLLGAVTGYISSAGNRSVLEVLQGRFTALPTLIFSFSRQIGDEWRANAAAAIIVLLVVILAVNAIAIVLRTRYERKW